MEKTIICIGREYGSGGHAIGKILAKRTGYEFYDKERFIAIARTADEQSAVFHRYELLQT